MPRIFIKLSIRGICHFKFPVHENKAMGFSFASRMVAVFRPGQAIAQGAKKGPEGPSLSKKEGGF
jgi:hypothetical protein